MSAASSGRSWARRWRSVGAGVGRQGAAGPGGALLVHAVVPAHGRQTCLHLFHGNAALDRADQGAEVAANAFLLDDARHMDSLAVDVPLAVASHLVGRDALVRAVFAGHVA